MSQSWINEVFILTHKNSLQDQQKCFDWIIANITAKNKVTIMIKKRPDAQLDNTSIQNFFTIQEKVVEIKEEAKQSPTQLIEQQEEQETISVNEQFRKIIQEVKLLQGQNQHNQSLQKLELANSLKDKIDDDQYKQIANCELYLSYGIAYHSLLRKDDAIQNWTQYLNEVKLIQSEDIALQFLDDEILVLNTMAQIFFERRALDKSLNHYEHLLDIIAQSPEEKRQNRDILMVKGNSENSLGKIYYQMKNKEQAIHYFKQSIQTLKLVYGPQHISIANKLNNLGETYRVNKDYKKALECLLESLDIKEAEFKVPNRSTADTQYLVAMSYFATKQVETSIEHCLRGLEIYESKEVAEAMSQQEQMVQISKFSQSIGEMLVSQKKQKESIEYFQKAFENRKILYGVSNKDTLKSANFLAHLQFQFKNYEESKKVFEDVIN